MNENRRHIRYKAVEGALASFSSPDMPSLNILAEIIDICASGLSVRFKSRDQMSSASRVNIFAYMEPFISIEGIPCKIVYETGIDATTRRCGIEFGDLSESQRSQLEYFIKSYTEGEA